MPSTTLYVPLGPDLEIAVTFQARAFNGISSDPKVILREPTLSEFVEVSRTLGTQIGTIPHEPTLDYPEQN